MQFTPTAGTGRPLPPAAWYPDPTGRHEARYWDGTRWTDHVCTRGQVGIDALLPAVPVGIASPPPSVPAGSSSAPASRIRGLGGLTTALTLLLSIAAAIGAFSLFAFFNRVAVINDILDLGPESGGLSSLFDLQQRADDADDYVAAAVVTTALVSITVLVLLIVWMWRVAKNAQTIGRTQPRFGPGWTIGGWFIPFANLVIPVLVMQDLWRASSPEAPAGDGAWRRRPGSAIVGWWWAAFILAGGRFGFGSEAQTVGDLERLRVSDSIAGVASLAAIAAAVLLIVVVRSITRRQVELLARTGAARGIRPE